jgi:hypothetical protein
MKKVLRCQYPLKFLCNWTSAVLDNETGNLLKYRHLLKHPKYKDVWSQLFSTEMHCLIITSKTTFSIKKEDIPNDQGHTFTYGRICCNYRSEKKDPYRTQNTMGGNLINYPGDCGTPTADILTIKSLFNSIVSTPHAKFMTINIKDFYLMTPRTRYKYFRMKLELIPQESLMNTISPNRWIRMVMPIGKYDKGCTDYRKRASLYKNFWRNASRKQDTSRAASHLVTGLAIGNPLCLP